MANTGYLITTLLKKVTDDINEYPLDVNGNLCSVTGLPQDIKSNSIGDPDYIAPYLDDVCEEPTPDPFTFTPVINANLSTIYESNIITLTGI